MGMRDELPAVDCCIIPTQFVSGILPPRNDGGVWIVDVFEDRKNERIVVARYAMTDAAYRQSITIALTPVAERLGILTPRVTLDS